MSQRSPFDVIVVGGGLNGLATAYHLKRMGCDNLAVFEQFPWGHNLGSSHGEARITRSAYHDRVYAQLMQHSHKESWPQLERDANEPLIFPYSCCVYGPRSGPFPDYAEAVLAAGADVIELDYATAVERFPALRFNPGDGVLDDRTAGLVAAERTLQSLLRLARKHDVKLMDQTPILKIEPRNDGVVLHTSDGEWFTERLVVTAGAWATRLVPQLAQRLFVTRQLVMYLELGGLSSRLQQGDYPIWAYLAEGANGLHYSMPSLSHHGIKIARHMVEGAECNPDEPVPDDNSAMMDYLKEFIGKRLHAPLQEVLRVEHCLYTNTPTEDFVLDHHPEHPMITIGAGFSGHGFKFGPLTGQILAELCLQGTSSITVFNDNRAKFQCIQTDEG